MQDKLKFLPWLMNLGLLVVCFAPIGPQIPQPFERSDLMYHALSFMMVGLAYTTLLYRPIVILPLLFLEGIAIEFIQPYFGRFFEGWDILANGLGLLVAWMLTKKINRALKKNF